MSSRVERQPSGCLSPVRPAPEGAWGCAGVVPGVLEPKWQARWVLYPAAESVCGAALRRVDVAVGWRQQMCGLLLG